MNNFKIIPTVHFRNTIILYFRFRMLTTYCRTIYFYT